MILVTCGDNIVNPRTRKKIDTVSNKKENNKCAIYNITDDIVKNWPNKSSDVNDPEYVIPCSGVFNNLSTRFTYIDDNKGTCTVRKAVTSIVQNDLFTFTQDDSVKCVTKFTGFKKTNKNTSINTNVCYQNCKNSAQLSFFWSIA